jgi:hypothetical protein
MSSASKFKGLPAGEKWDEVGLLASFNRDYNQKVTDFDVLQKILGTPAVEQWYAEYKKERSIALALPAQWKKLGMTPEQWASHLEANVRRKVARAKHSNVVNEIAAKYQKQIRDAEANLAAELAATANPITAIMELGYNDLPVGDLVQVEAAPNDAARAVLLQAKLDAMRRTAIGSLP